MSAVNSLLSRAVLHKLCEFVAVHFGIQMAASADETSVLFDVGEGLCRGDALAGHGEVSLCRLLEYAFYVAVG